MKKIKAEVLLIFAALSFLAMGCAAKKNVFVLIPDDDGMVGEMQISNEKGTQVINKAYNAVYVDDKDSPPARRHLSKRNRLNLFQ